METQVRFVLFEHPVRGKEQLAAQAVTEVTNPTACGHLQRCHARIEPLLPGFRQYEFAHIVTLSPNSSLAAHLRATRGIAVAPIH